MRRISLALALMGAVAVTGCSSGGNSTPTSSGVQHGTQGKNFYVNLFTPPMGGFIASSDGSINCGASAKSIATSGGVSVYSYTNYAKDAFSAGVPAAVTDACGQKQFNWYTDATKTTLTTVTLTVAAAPGNSFVGWAGDCTGSAPTCTLTAGPDASVVAIFGAPGSSGHPNFMDGKVHGAAYLGATLTCSNCHGANLQGAGIAPACNSCHGMPHFGSQFSAAAVKDCNWGSETCGGFPKNHPAAYYADASAPAGTPNCFGCHSGKNFMGAVTMGLAPGNGLVTPACFSCHASFNHNSYTHPAAYEGEFFSGGRTGYTPNFIGTFSLTVGTGTTMAGTYNVPGITGALPVYGSYKAGAETWEPNCVGCHGTADTRGAAPAGIPLEGFANGAPSCAECHYAPPQPEVLATAVFSGGVTTYLSNHFSAGKEAWALYSFSQACERCHTADGFRDYVGADGSAANNLAGTFNMDATGPAGTQGMTGGGYAPGPLQCSVCHNAVTDPSRDLLHGVHVTGLTSIRFPSLMTVTGVDKGRALCGTCHQARVSTANITNVIAAKPIDPTALGQTYVSVTVNSAGAAAAAGSLTTVNFGNVNKNTVPAPVQKTVVPGLGYTAIFNGSVTSGLNGKTCTVAGVTISESSAATAYSSFTCAAALPVAPQFAPVPCVLASGTTTTCMTTPGGATKVTAPGAGYAMTGDSVILYPTATGGSTTTLVDANRDPALDTNTLMPTSWTAGKWTAKAFYVYFHTGLNAGKFAKITANDSTSLTFAAQTAAVAAGDFYEIVAEDASTVDAVTLATADGNSYASSIGLQNPHYLGAAATEYGALAAGWYQFPNAPAVYRGSSSHTRQTVTVADAGGATYIVAAATCADCHDAHTLEIKETSCFGCHGMNYSTVSTGTGGTTSTMFANKTKGDFDNSGTDIGVRAEIESLKATLWQKILAYSVAKASVGSSETVVGAATSTAGFYSSGAPICFDNVNNAYWFIGSSQDLTPDADGACYDGTGAATACCKSGIGWGASLNSAAAASGKHNMVQTGLSPRLLRATYNYKFAMKDPGAWAHNGRYTAQVLIDTINDLNVGLGLPATFGKRP
jgi:hypothetical protein